MKLIISAAALVLLQACSINTYPLACNDAMSKDIRDKGTPISEGYVFFEDDEHVLARLDWELEDRVYYLSTPDGCLVEDKDYYQ